MPQARTRPVHKANLSQRAPAYGQIVDLVSEEELPASEEEFFSDVDQDDEKTTDEQTNDAKDVTTQTETKAAPMSASDVDEGDEKKPDAKDATAKTETAQTATNESEAAKPDDKEHGLGEKRKRKDTPATLQDGAKSTCL